MESRPPAAQELADRGLGPKRLQQLDVAVADVEQRRIDALLGHGLAVDEWHAQLVAVERERVVDALDGDADVVDGGQHGAAEHIGRLSRLGGRVAALPPWWRYCSAGGPGATDDLRRVADIAYSMIHDYAMGTGFTSLRVNSELLSETTRRVRDEEVRELADEAFRAAQELLRTHRAQLDQLAAALLADEVLEREEIDRIMAGIPVTAPDRRAGFPLGIAAATTQPGSSGRPWARWCLILE